MNKVPKCCSCGSLVAVGEKHQCKGRTLTAPTKEGGGRPDFTWVAPQVVASSVLGIVGDVAEGTADIIGSIVGGLFD
jgi:hypothetical protein